jgi:membrane protein
MAGVALLFALIFKYVPETKIAWKDIWLGAAVTAFFFTLGKYLVGIYLGKTAVGSAYGAAGSLVVVVVWVYYSAMIFFFGAELTHVLASAQVEFSSNSAPKMNGSQIVTMAAHVLHLASCITT